MQDSRYPFLAALPDCAPRKHGGFARAFGRFCLRLAGWRIEGEFPDHPNLLIIAAPHTSWWDGAWGLIGKLALGLDVCIIAKAELFRWPLGPLLRWLGVRPVDRSRAHGMVGEASSLLRNHERLWFLLAPEGTRKAVPKWKSGFWHIARGADVPVMCAAFDYANKRICVGPTVRMTEDRDADLLRLYAHYAQYPGANPRNDGWRKLGRGSAPGSATQVASEAIKEVVE
ncbi:MAG: lysophospholipid acyltransferase family protein [Xanthomonadales bacterium]|nr:lysophospholipid acyltransferase family protein [Xanthomonadales bacterium]